MAIYGRAGNRVIVQRLAKLADVKKYDNRKPDKQDRERLKLDCLLLVSDAEHDDGKLRLYDIAFLRADFGIREIMAVVEACKANGGRAP
jgi:hypothetical protein